MNDRWLSKVGRKLGGDDLANLLQNWLDYVHEKSVHMNRFVVKLRALFFSILVEKLASLLYISLDLNTECLE